jgi:hypothetical protein
VFDLALVKLGWRIVAIEDEVGMRCAWGRVGTARLMLDRSRTGS